MYLHELNIGNLKLENNILLAPMAGITDLPFRLICERFNPGITTTEMVSSKAILYNDEKTKKLMNITNEKRPIAIQIFGSEIEAMSYASKYVSNIADVVDINMGCPAPKVTKNGDGSSLLKNLDHAGEIIDAVVKNSAVPVSLKIRIGWDKENIVATEIAKIAERIGVSMITVHGRTRSEFYSGKADWDIIRKVKENVNIPVIGNGDVRSGKDAFEMFEKTNCDGIMISRASLGNPWIFEEVKDYLQNATEKEEDKKYLQNEQAIDKNLQEKYKKQYLYRESEKENKNSNFQVSSQEKMNIILEHIELETEEKGENVGIKEMRKHIAFYLKGEPDASKLREKINHMETKEEVTNAIREYFEGKNL